MMKGMVAVVAFALLTALSWGIYGPIVHAGQQAMGHTMLRPFIWVGVAYFLIAVVAPIITLRVRGEPGAWTPSGTMWSLFAGTLGAIGALGIILSFFFGGRPVYVMPLVYGGAPAVNTLLTMYMGKAANKLSPLFLTGLIMIALGAVTVLLSKPNPPSATDSANLPLVALFVAMTALSWGAYGPLLHKGQQAMGGSRLRPFICVGAAYFVIAVLFPLLLLGLEPEGELFKFSGMAWSFLGGAVGAIGALGIIMAFTAGGKPIYVMPLVFGGAPVVNALTTILVKNESIGALFLAGLILVIAGAVMVLVFAPKGQPHPAPATT